MLKEIDSKTTRATCNIYCKKCCRREYHFLNVRGKLKRAFYKLFTLSTIGLYGQYRCVCCGTPRIGRFDIVRGRSQKEASFDKSDSWNPLNWWFNRRDSWEGMKRRKRRRKMLTGSRRKKKYRHKPFRKKFW